MGVFGIKNLVWFYWFTHVIYNGPMIIIKPFTLSPDGYFWNKSSRQKLGAQNKQSHYLDADYKIDDNIYMYFKLHSMPLRKVSGYDLISYCPGTTETNVLPFSFSYLICTFQLSCLCKRMIIMFLSKVGLIYVLNHMIFLTIINWTQHLVFPCFLQHIFMTPRILCSSPQQRLISCQGN